MRHRRAALLLLIAAAATPALAQNDPAWDSVQKAFVAGTPIPEASFEGPDQALYTLIKKVSSGCVAPCQTTKYMQNIALISRARRLTGVEKIQAVYCPGTPPICRLRKLATAAATAKPSGDDKSGAAADPRRAAAAKTGAIMARALAQNKSAGPPVGPGRAAKAPVASVDAPTPPPPAPPPPTPLAPLPAKTAPGAAAPPPPAAPPSSGFMGRLLDKILPDKRQQLVLARAESTGKVAAAAQKLLEGLPGEKAKALAARFTQASAIADPAARAEAQRTLITEADGVLMAVLERKLEDAVSLSRQETCKAGKPAARAKCLGAKTTPAELAAAREKVFTEMPELGLYFVGRSEHQLFLKDKMAAGELWAGLRLAPWELGTAAPPGTTITVDADKNAEADGGNGGAPYLGLTFALADGSSRFEGARPAKDGLERLVVVSGAGGERTRSTAVVKPGAQEGRETVLSAETLYYAPGGRLVRAETMSGAGSHVEIKDYNVKGKEKELRRYEIRDRKGGKERVEIRDPDNLRNTVTGYDGSVTVTSRVPKGLPVDPSKPDGSRWLEQHGRMINGKFQLEGLTLEDATVLKGSSKTGRFLVTDIEEKGGKKLHGESDPKTGAFKPTSVIEKDGSGQRQYGRVLITMGPGGQPLRYTVPLRREVVNRPNAFGLAGEFVGAAALEKERVGALGEWLFDQMSRTSYSSDGDEGVRGAMLAAEKPGKEVVFLLIVNAETTEGSGAYTEQVGHQTVGHWETGTKYNDETVGLVLRATDDQGVPTREYVAYDKMRKWVKGYSNDGPAGAFSSSKEFEHLFLVQFHRDPKREKKWISSCAEEDDGVIDKPGTPCAERAEVGKPQVIHTTSSGLSDLGSELGDLPVLKQAGKYATKGYYTAVGYLQDDIGFDTSSNPDKRLAVIANKYRGVVSKQATLEELASDPALLKEVDEKVVEKRKEAHHAECVQLGDGCDAYMRGLNCKDASSRKPCASKEERLQIIEYAYSPSHAIDYASEGGSKFLYVLGGLGQAGEMAAASLPVMGMTEGLGALGKVKFVGGAATFVNGAMGGLMTTGWIVGGLANGAELVDGIKTGDMSKIVKSGVQAGGDFMFAYKGHADGKAKAAKKAAVEKSLAVERERLEKIDTLPDTGYSSVQLDLHNASPAELVKYREALKVIGIEEPKLEHGIAEFELSPRKKAQLEERLKGTSIESIDFQETGKRQDERAPFTGDEVDAMFDQQKNFSETAHYDLSEYPPKDYKRLREEVGKLGGKIDIKDGIATVTFPNGNAAEFAKRIEGTPAKPMSVEDYVKAKHENAGGESEVGAGEHADKHDPSARSGSVSEPRQIEQIWDTRNGANLTRPETVRADRLAALKAAKDPALAKAVAAAVARGDIAPASWQGRQGQEGNCLPHALANASNGAFTLAETVDAGVKAGADYKTGGTSEPQLMQMLLTLEEVGAAKDMEVDYRAIPVEEYFRGQEEAAASGKKRQAGLLAIRTGLNASDMHGYHAVALRGQIVVEGQHYIVITDSHLNEPLLYTPEAFSAAALSEGILVIDVKHR